MERLRFNNFFSGIIFVVVICLIGLIEIAGLTFASDKEGKLPVETLEVCPSAKITAVDYFIKESEFSGGPKLHVKVGIKNISDQPKRYRLSIFLPDGASSGGFYPRKGRPPVIKPGEEQSLTFPMYFENIPDAVTLRVEEL